MEFFKQLAAIGNIDMTIRIMQKNDKFTINVMPGSGSSTMQPIVITGTPDELDNEFVNAIVPQVNEVAGLVHNIDSVKKNLSNKKDDKGAPAKDKVIKKAPEKNTDQVEEPQLFEDAQ